MNRPIGMHHVGVPVRSIERSLAWYHELFDLEPEFVDLVQGEVLSRTVQLDEARMRAAFVDLGNTVLELLEYEQPVGRDFTLRNCDVGAMHICLEVADIDAVYERLCGMGVAFSIEPVLLDGVHEGHRCCYFRDPDGIQLELWQRPA